MQNEKEQKFVKKKKSGTYLKLLVKLMSQKQLVESSQEPLTIIMIII